MLMLLINGTGAFYGGLSLITDPSGEKLQLPANYLQNIPFNSYLIPGIIMIIVNGLFSFTCLLAFIIKHEKAPVLIIIQGITLSCWIIVQLFMVKDFYPPLHGSLLLTGLLLIVCGFYFKFRNN